jgi:hypothetical protein
MILQDCQILRASAQKELWDVFHQIAAPTTVQKLAVVGGMSKAKMARVQQEASLH